MTLGKCEAAIVEADRRAFLDACPGIEGCAGCAYARGQTLEEYLSENSTARAALWRWRESLNRDLTLAQIRAAHGRGTHDTGG